MRHPSGCYAKLLRFLQLSKFTFFNAKIWLQLLRVPYNTPMCGGPSHNSIPALKPTTTALKSGLRHTASRGREIAVGALCHALANKLPVAPLRCTTPRFAVHSFSPPFLWLQSPPLRTGSSSPHIATLNPFA